MFMHHIIKSIIGSVVLIGSLKKKNIVHLVKQGY